MRSKCQWPVKIPKTPVIASVSIKDSQFFLLQMHFFLLFFGAVVETDLLSGDLSTSFPSLF